MIINKKKDLIDNQYYILHFKDCDPVLNFIGFDSSKILTKYNKKTNIFVYKKGKSQTAITYEYVNDCRAKIELYDHNKI